MIRKPRFKADQVAAAVGVDLHGLGARGRHAAGIVVGLQVAFDDGHAELAGQVMQLLLGEASLCPV